MKKRVLSKAGLVISLAISLACFLFIYFVAGNAIVSLIFGLLSFYIFAFIFTKSESNPLASNPILAQQQEFSEAFAQVKAANLKAVEIAKYAKSVSDPKIRQSAEHVYDSSKKIIDTLFQSPKDVTTITNFMDYYLPVTCSILGKYVRAESKGAVEDDSKFREKVQKFMSEMESAMKNQLKALFEDDLMDAGLDIDVMTTTLKNEGLLDSGDFDITPRPLG